MDFGNKIKNSPQSVSSIEPVKKPEPEPIVVEKESSLGKTIAIIILSITTAAFAGLFVWKLFDWIDASTDLQSQIDRATSIAVLETQTQMEAEFTEREKEPYRPFLGPSDYGSLSFSYPKTWSLYVANDASNGGEYTAYFNPTEIPPINSSNSIVSLRVSIKTQAFDSIVSSYENYVKSGKMDVRVVNINNNTATANIYHGTLYSPSEAIGYIAVIKIRDKTAVIQTDSELFQKDFEKMLSTLTFNS